MSYTLTQLLDLPVTEYTPAHKAEIDCRQVVLADMYGLVVSNSASTRPHPGTHMLGDCIGILAVNPSTQTASFGHAHGCEAEAVRMAVDAVRKNPEEPVELYFLGADCDHVYDAEAPLRWRARMDALVNGINGLENIFVNAFDVDEKPHPTDVALQWLDNGYRLVRLTPLHRSSDPEPLVSDVPGEALFQELTHCSLPVLPEDDPRYEDTQLIRFMRQNQRKMHSPVLFEDLEEATSHIPTSDAPLILQWDGRQPENQRRDITSRPDPVHRNR